MTALRWAQINVPELAGARGQLLETTVSASTADTVNYRQEWRLYVESRADTTYTTAQGVPLDNQTTYAGLVDRYASVGSVRSFEIQRDWYNPDLAYVYDRNVLNRYVMPVRDQTLTIEGTMNTTQWAAFARNEWTNMAVWADSPLTDEQKAKIARKAANDKRRREFAVIRARRLLADHMTQQELDQLAEHGYFEVTSSSGRRYRIYRGHSRNVVELDKLGREVNRLCAHPNLGSRMPDEDHMLAQKLLLENDEAAYRRVANHSRIYIPGQQAA